MRPLEATVSLLTAALQRIRADAVAEVLGWPGGCFIAVGVCLYIAATNLARNVSEWRDWNRRTRRLPQGEQLLASIGLGELAHLARLIEEFQSKLDPYPGGRKPDPHSVPQ